MIAERTAAELSSKQLNRSQLARKWICFAKSSLTRAVTTTDLCYRAARVSKRVVRVFQIPKGYDSLLSQD